MRLARYLALPLLLALPAAAQQQDGILRQDERLQKRVSVRWKKATLHEALEELSRATGARLTPARMLVDEPVMASAANVPAHEVMEQLAKLTHFTWARSGTDPMKPTYLFFQGKAAQDEEQAEIDGAKRAVLEALNREVEKYRRIASLSPDQLEQELRKSDQQLSALFQNGGIASLGSNAAAGRTMMDGMAVRSVASPLGRTMVRMLDDLSPAEWQQLESGEPIVYSTAPRSGERHLAPVYRDSIRDAAPTFPFPKELFNSFGGGVSNAINELEGRMKNEWGRATGYKISVSLSLNMGSQPVGMLRVSPEPMGGDEDVAPIFAVAGLTIVGAPQLLEEPEEDPQEREKRLAADPFLGKKAKLKLPPLEKRTGFLAMLGNAYRVAEILPAVEEAFGVPIVADAYNRSAMAVIPPPGDQELPLFKVLDQMAGSTRRWERDGSVIRLRSRTWAHDRRGEIPSRYMKRWLEVREAKDGFTLEDLAEIAAMLRDEQVESLMFSAMELGSTDFTDFVMISANREILRFYGKLLPLQRQRLYKGEPIPVRTLFPFQQALLARVNRGQNQSLFSLAMGARASRSPQVLAAGSISLERAEPGGGAAPAQPRARVSINVGGAGASGSVSGIGTVYTLRILLPDGQKDEFRIPLSKPSRVPAEAPEPVERKE
ncbi:MAG: hypothetical protein ACK47B_04760 [Armatimonadota bacterium]